MAIGRSDMSGIRRLIEPLARRIVNTVARGIVKHVDDSTKLQLLQIAGLQVEIDSRELHDESEHMQPYGFYAVPLDGAESVTLYPNGDRGLALVLAVSDRRYRPTGGQGGEVGLYTDEGDQVRLGRGHVVVISTIGQVKIGSSSASAVPALIADLAALKAAIAGWSGGGTSDGGVSLKAAVAAWSPVGSTKVRVE